jgi:hypothetical protein
MTLTPPALLCRRQKDLLRLVWAENGKWTTSKHQKATTMNNTEIEGNLPFERAKTALQNLPPGAQNNNSGLIPFEDHKDQARCSPSPGLSFFGRRPHALQLGKKRRSCSAAIDILRTIPGEGDLVALIERAIRSDELREVNHALVEWRKAKTRLRPQLVRAALSGTV